MIQIKQTDRLLKVYSVLGSDILTPIKLHFNEAISEVFQAKLTVFSAKTSIAPNDLIGTRVTVQVDVGLATGPRSINGFVSHLSQGGFDSRVGRYYQINIVPWLWFLQYSSDSQIFQEKTALQIAEDIFKQFNINDYKSSGVSGNLPIHEYCVQYQETAFNFVSRLLAEEGIYYYFEHSKDKHTLVLANRTTSYQNCVEKKVQYDSATPGKNVISAWEQCYAFTSGKYSQMDYNFETPNIDLSTSTESTIKLSNNSKYEHFIFPGNYTKKAEGDDKTKLLMEHAESQYNIINGQSTLPVFTPGFTFELEQHDVAAESGKEYVLISVRHDVCDSSGVTADDGGQSYENSFSCIPAKTVFKPAQNFKKPLISGLQTAIVTGPSGEEIYTDKYGRIKLHFYWDRKNELNEKSSCWVRVAQTLAGKKWGAIFIPRVGQEVTVAFLEGDPDRPLVVASVYNADQMPPYALPANMTQSGFKSHSTKEGGSEANEFRFEDKKNAEEVYLHAQKDFNSVVEHDQTISVKNDRVKTIEEGDETITLKKGNRTTTIESGDESLEVKKGKRTVTLDSSDDILNVKQGNRVVDVNMGDDKHTIAQGNRLVELKMGNDTLNIKVGNQTTKISLGKSSTQAMQGIELKVGQSSVKLDQAGVTIEGMKVSINGQIMTEVKAGAMLTLKGGITMIN